MSIYTVVLTISGVQSVTCSNKIFTTAFFSQLLFYAWVKMACRNTSVWSTSFQYPLGKPSLIHGQASPCTVLFTTVPAGADVCVCSLVRPQIFSSCSHSSPPTGCSWFFAMMVKSIKKTSTASLQKPKNLNCHLLWESWKKHQVLLEKSWFMSAVLICIWLLHCSYISVLDSVCWQTWGIVRSLLRLLW